MKKKLLTLFACIGMIITSANAYTNVDYIEYDWGNGTAIVCVTADEAFNLQSSLDGINWKTLLTERVSRQGETLIYNLQMDPDPNGYFGWAGTEYRAIAKRQPKPIRVSP